MNFQRIDPASRAAQARSPLGLYRYPQRTDWRDFQIDQRLFHTVLSNLEATTRGVLAVVGPHGSGKTFHLFYLGHWWEANRSPLGLAFYVHAPSVLDPDDAVKLWRDCKGRKCLWLIDDVHSDTEQLTKQLADEFEELALEGHWLIAAGWSASGIEDAAVQPWPLTRDTVRFALQAKQHLELAADEQLVEALPRSRVGLRQILWAARDRPDLLHATEHLEDEWAEHMIVALRGPALQTLAILARLRFLGLPFLPTRVQETARLEEAVRITGFAQQLEPGRGFDVPDEDIAQLLLRRELGDAEDTGNAAARYLFPLRDYVCRLLAQRQVGLPGRVFHGLSVRTRGDLAEWIKGHPRDGEELDFNLLDDFLDDALLDSVRTAVVGHQDVGSAVRLLVALRRRSDWARNTGSEILRQLDLCAWSRGVETDLSTWRTFATLAYLAEDEVLQSAVAQSSRSEALRRGFREGASSERWSVLGTARLVSEEAYSTFLGILLETLKEEVPNLRPRAAWRRLWRLAEREASKAASLLQSFDSAVLKNLVLGAPSAARQLLAKLHPRRSPEARRMVAALFEQVLKSHSICDDDVASWIGASDLISIIVLSRQHPDTIDVDPVLRQVTQAVQGTNAGVLTDLTHDVAKFGRGTKLREHLAQRMLETLLEARDPICERLEALARLDHHLLSEDVLTNTISKWRTMEPSRVFRLLWYAVLVSPRGAGCGRSLAREIITDWRSIAASGAPLTAVALSGLCTFALEDESDQLRVAAVTPLRDLVEPSKDTPSPTSPQLVVCQVLALARAVDGRSSPWYGNLAWLVESLAQPSARYKRAWHRMAPVSARRLALEVLSPGLQALAQRNLSELVEVAAAAVTKRDHDDIWDEHLSVRIELATCLGGIEAARTLLKRRSDAWACIIGDRILQARPDRPVYAGAVEAALRLLILVADLAAGGDRQVREAAKNVLVAVTPKFPPVRRDEASRLLTKLE